MDCDPDSNLDLGPGAHVNTAKDSEVFGFCIDMVRVIVFHCVSKDLLLVFPSDVCIGSMCIGYIVVLLQMYRRLCNPSIII